MLIRNPPVELADGVWMLGTNEYPVFLVISRNEGAIFEGGVGAVGPVVAEQLAGLGIAGDCVKQIVITHAHPDHVMAVPAFRAMFADVKVCASKVAAETLSMDKAVAYFVKIDAVLTEALIKAGSITDKHRPEPLKDKRIAVDRILSDGDTVTVGDMEFDCLATPGHSDCSLSFHEPARGILIVSDATGYYLPDSEYFWPCYFGDYGAYIESIRRLAGLDAEILCLSHNAAIKGRDAVRTYFDGAIAATENWHRRILAETKQGKCSEMIGDELGAEVYQKNQLMSENFFQKNCALLVKQSIKYAGND
ncbi:MAG TPA: MBL fold metallo-hydrolase [Sedimentisphaerales bacterium]|nr:MBL fold metallo-hydrolase [Sedimentisphaerales bacterium]